MSKSNVFENDLLKLVFNGIAVPFIADNAGATPLTHLYVSLHTADPGEAGVQTTNECTYTGYARVAVTRDSLGFTITNNMVNPTADITFPQVVAGSETATFFAIGTDNTGASGKILYSGALSPVIGIAPGAIPILKTATAITED